MILKVAEKISSKDGESHRCQQEAPCELLVAGVHRAGAAAPALEWRAVGGDQAWASWCRR